MKISNLFLLSIFLTAHAAAFAAGHDLPAGGRRALHGMVLYGSGPYFLDHIPMDHQPHDFQIIAEAVLEDQKGNAVKKNFSQATFTLKPSGSFSLNDYVSGRIKNFSGSIYEGSFEQGGAVISGLDNVRVVVKELKLARQIPAVSDDQSIQLTDGTNTFQINVITPQRSFQKIENKSSGEELWCVKGPDFFDSCSQF